MNWIFHIVPALSILILATDLTLIVRWLFHFKSHHFEPVTWPHISILVAARNEGPNIVACLEKLLRLDYPSDKMEVLVGNDKSKDSTLKLARELAEKDGRVKVIDIKYNLGLARGKANVLAQLAREAQGEYYFITDADTQVPEGWVKTLLSGLGRRAGIVSGVTTVGGRGLWARLQNMEWLIALGMLKVVTDLGIPVTGVGNNMVITRAAYEKVGGYEQIPFSIVEDFQLTREVLRAKFEVINMFNAGVSATTKPAENVSDLLNQRKRWMHGAIKIPFVLKLILFAQILTIPVFITLVFYDLGLALAFLFLKILLRAAFTFLVYKKVNQKIDFDTIFIYDLYAGFFSIMTLLYYAVPVKLDWKGRKY